MRKVPVFFIQGFLDSGKSTFILATIKRDEFYTRGKTLIICCEEGEIEYDKEDLAHYKTEVVYIENEEDFNDKKLNELYKQYKPDRVVVEMNFMWDQNELSLPTFMPISQVITLIDGPSFPVYYANMRQKFTDAIKLSDVVAFTKLESRESLAPYETALKMNSSSVFFCLIDENCISTMEAFEAKLPYDLDSESFEVKDNDFATFYIDTFDNRPKYEGKIVTFNAWVKTSKKLPKDTFIAGRQVLNCCANDIQLYGFLVSSTLGQKLKDESWVRVKGTCHIEYNDQYQEEEVIIAPIEITQISPIPVPVLDLRG